MSAWICLHNGLRAPPPERRISATIDAHLADQFQAVAHGEGRAFEDAPRIRWARGRGGRSGRSRPPLEHTGSEVGAALAGEIGEEEQPLGSRAWRAMASSVRRKYGSTPCDAGLARPRHLDVAKLVAVATGRSLRRRGPRRRRSRTRRGWRGRSVGGGPSGRNPARGCGRTPRRRCPSWPTRSRGGRSRCPPRRPAGPPPPPTIGVPARPARWPTEPDGRDRRAETSWLSKQSGRSAASMSSLPRSSRLHRRLATSSNKRPRGVADLGRERAAERRKRM